MENEKEKEVKEISEAIDELMDNEISLDSNEEETKDDLPIDDLLNNLDNENVVSNESDNDNQNNDEPNIDESNIQDGYNESINYPNLNDDNDDTILLSNDVNITDNNQNTNFSSLSDDSTAQNYTNTTNDANDKNFYMGYTARLVINIVVIVLCFLIATLFLVTSISIKSRSSIIYKQSSDLDYKVYLKENDYYKEPYLDENMRYIASLIDNVNVTFNYNFFANQNINYKYTYYVKADVSVTDTEDKTKIIYSNKEKLTEPKTIAKTNSTGFTINENLKINYAEYNDLVKSFKSSYGISASSDLVLSLLVGIEDEKGTVIKKLDSNEVMSLTIPLTEQMINISMNSNETNNSENAKIYKDFNISNKVNFALSITSLLIAIIFIFRLFIFLKKTKPSKTIYDVTLAKILREYDRVIVNSKKAADLSDDVVDVNSFEELLDVRDNLEKPIIFKEIHKGQKSLFVVKTANETYRYTMKLSDLEKDKNK